MTDDKVTQSDPVAYEGSEPLRPLDVFDLIDPVLSREAHAANILNTTIPVTFVVSGEVWQGRLTSQAQFFEEQKEFIGNLKAGSEMAAKYIAARIEGLDRLVQEAHESARDFEDPRDPSYIHLREATKIGSGATLPQVRFKITAIDGWAYGHPE